MDLPGHGDPGLPDGKEVPGAAHQSLRQIAEISLPAIPFRVAATSFTYPGTVAQNARRLAGVFPEMAVLLFESLPCLDYKEEDLPAELARLGLDYHLHLPLDLDFSQGVQPPLEVIARLAEKCAHLAPRAHVLHPPEDTALLPPLARGLERVGLGPGRFLLENTLANSLEKDLETALDLGFSLCLDLGHIMAYGQYGLLAEPGVFEAARMLHLSTPGEADRHLGLDRLNSKGRDVLRTMLENCRPDTVLCLEVFSEAHLAASLEALAGWCPQWRII